MNGDTRSPRSPPTLDVDMVDAPSSAGSPGTRLDMLDVDLQSVRHDFAAMSFQTTLRDPTIHCTCGTTRPPKEELVFAGHGELSPSWVHIACHPRAAAAPLQVDLTTQIATGSKGSKLALDTIILGMAGPQPTREQVIKIKNFRTRFHCDGPCTGSTKIVDFFLCRKCCGWQHKECMLYGDAPQEKNPVCNRCYVSFIVHHDEVVGAQRRQLVRAVTSAFEYLMDPDHEHEAWRRGRCIQLVSQFLEDNHADFRQWLLSRRPSTTNQPLPLLPLPTAISQMLDAIESEVTRQKSEVSIHKTVLRPKATKKQPVQVHEDSETDNDDTIQFIPIRPKNGPRAAPEKVAEKRKIDWARMPRTARKSAPSTFWRQDDSDSETEVEGEDKEEQEPPSKKARRRVNEVSDYRVSCRCNVPPPAVECFKCVICRMHQHSGCADDNQDGVPILCNFCFNRSIEDATKSAADPPPAATRKVLQTLAPEPAVSPPADAPEEVDAAIREEIEQLCSSVLWKEYCSIPDPPSDQTGVAYPLTMPKVPKYAPGDWLEEVQARANKLLDAAGPAPIQKHLLPVLSSFPRRNDAILKALREIAIEQLFHGAYKGLRKELGVLAEVLGLEDKGKYWKIG